MGYATPCGSLKNKGDSADLRRMAPLVRIGRWTLLSKFTALSLVCFALLGVVLAQVLAHQLRARALSNTVASAQLLSDVLVRTQLEPRDMTRGLAPARAQALDVAVDQARAQHRIARVKIWSRTGTVVYSDARSEVGRRFEVEGDLKEAFEGNSSVDVAHGAEAEQRGEKGLGKLLEAYVPLRFAPHAPPAGAFEIYLPYAPVEHAAARDVHFVYALVAGALALLYLLLYRTFARASRSLRRQALQDPLTGLPNRRCLYTRVDPLLARSAARGRTVALLLADLDGFKELNDTLGHHAGDLVLTQLGPRLMRELPDVELLARVGGDEFAVVVVGERKAVEVAERFRAALAEPFVVDGIRLAVQASVGISYSPEHGSDVGALLQRADIAMYQAKAGQRGSVEYEPTTDGHSRARLALAGEFRRAISDRELVVYYQPKAELATGTVTSVEALVRWRHPEHGLLPPAEFVPMAEQTDLIKPLALFVLEDAMSQAREWEDLGLDLRIAVNLSMANLLDTELPADIARLLAKYRLAPHRIVVEITENVVMADPGRTLSILSGLRSLGIGLSLDDFGIGHSSLAHLRELDVDELKIDRSFVSDMRKDKQNAAIVRSTIELAHAMGLRVVAEGVEDADTLFDLKTMGADAVQGYYLSQPVPGVEILAMLMHALRGAPEGQPAGTSPEPV
jgi:diguanylate cyclase (GGDEF)-like protein